MGNKKNGLIIKNPFVRKKKIISEFTKIYEEWIDWKNEVSQIIDMPYDKNTQLDVFADGEDMMQYHNALQAKTITFLDNNLENHWFITRLNGDGIDRTNLRLHHRIKHRISDLEQIKQSLPYAQSFWGVWINKNIDRLIRIISSFIGK